MRDGTSRWNGFRDRTMMLIKVRTLKALGDFRLSVEFSDDTIGERDFSFLPQDSGPMLEPLKDPAYFRRGFVEDGVATSPNGFEWNPIALRDEMQAAGLLRPIAAAE